RPGSIAASCGPTAAPPPPSRDPGREDRAPLRRAALGTLRPARRCDPGREDRAPLRHHRRLPGCGDLRRVTPVAKTGLHCGSSCGDHHHTMGWVTPVAKTGLHCGAVTRHRLLELRWTSDPGREDRAPLRLVEDG